MANQYARGDRAWGICGRSGIKMLRRDMVFDGRYPNLLVHPDWYEGKHPQEELPKVEDPVALWRPAPETVLPPSAPVLTVNLLGLAATLLWTPAENNITEMASYDIYRAVDGGTFSRLIRCAVLRDFLGGIIGVQNCTTSYAIPSGPGIQEPAFIKQLHRDAPVTYVDNTLTGGHTYCYFVQANPQGNTIAVAQGPPSAASDIACGNTFFLSPPVLAAVLGSTGQDIQLSWTAPTVSGTTITGYRIYDAATNLLVVDTGNTALSFDVPNLAPSTTYNYYVVGYDAGNHVSGQSNVAGATTGNATQQVFPVGTSTWTSPNPLWVSLDAIVIGGGGGGGAAAGLGSNGFYNSAGAGGGGGYAKINLTRAQAGASIAVTVGAGGLGAVAVPLSGTGGGGVGVTGNPGGTSSFGAFAVATGGGAGTGQTNTPIGGAAGGTGSTSGGSSPVTSSGGVGGVGANGNTGGGPVQNGGNGTLGGGGGGGGGYGGGFNNPVPGAGAGGNSNAGSGGPAGTSLFQASTVAAGAGNPGSSALLTAISGGAGGGGGGVALSDSSPGAANSATGGTGGVGGSWGGGGGGGGASQSGGAVGTTSTGGGGGNGADGVVIVNYHY